MRGSMVTPLSGQSFRIRTVYDGSDGENQRAQHALSEPAHMNCFALVWIRSETLFKMRGLWSGRV